MEEIVYHTNYKLEDSYWWFVAKFKIVTKIIKKICKIPENAQILDVGCGTGGFTKKISESYQAIALDMSATALEYCKKRGIENRYLGTLDQFPKEDWNVKAITMLDVIEHIDNDQAVVKDAYDILPEGGYFIATVPANQWMWSKHDEIHMHKRRYNKKQFANLMKEAGFKIEYASYFNTFLFPVAAAKRILDKLTGADKKVSEPVEELPGFVNNLFEKIFSLEKSFIPSIKFPFGVSLIVIAKK